MLRIICFAMSLGLIVMSCRTSKTSKNKKEIPEQLNINQSGKAIDKIVFLTFSVTLQDSIKDVYTIALTNSIIANGVLKKNAVNKETVIEPNYLYVDITDKDQKRTELIKVRDPLMVEYEYPGEDNSLGKRIIRKQTGLLNFRFQFQASSTYISIYKHAPPPVNLKKIYHATL